MKLINKGFVEKVYKEYLSVIGKSVKMVYNFDISNFKFLPEGYSQAVAGGALGGALVALGVFVLMIVGLALYAYHAWAWMTIAKRMKYKKSWLAWVPFASSAMRLQLGKKFHWAWVFLFIIPVVGWMALWILLIISHWQIFEKLKHPGWFALAPVIDILPMVSGLGGILYLISVGIVAWKKK